MDIEIKHNLLEENLVRIIIPIYKPLLNEYEKISFDRTYLILEKYPITIIKPESLNIDDLLINYPRAKIETFKDFFFKGIDGYNMLMLSEEFYARFMDSTYLLICQLDAYIFCDELKYWCKKEYDYIGAPWIVRPIYRFPLFRFTSWIKKKYCSFLNKPNGQITNFKVGNGGLSLRKTASHLDVTRNLKPVINSYLSHKKRHHVYNEDVFWGVEVNKHGFEFYYPDYKEALKFSFDKYPALCFKLNNYQLPFGCHSWYKRKMKRFWLPIILNVNK